MNKFLNFLYNNIFSGGTKYKRSNLELNKIRALNVLIFIGTIVIFAYVIINIFIGDYGDAVFEFSWVILLIISFFLLRTKKRLYLAYIFGSIVLLLLSMNNFWTGGFSSTGIYWVFIVPAVIFFLLGYKKGLVFMMGLIVFFIALIVMADNGLVFLPYTIFNVTMFLLAFILLSLITFFYQFFQDKNQKIIEEQTENIKEANKKIKNENLKTNKAIQEMQKRADQLEKTNNLLIGRELKMVELKKEIEKLKKENS